MDLDRNVTQIWFCEVCNKQEQITINNHADIFSVIGEIENSHAETSPHCPNPVSRIRVLNPNYKGNREQELNKFRDKHLGSQHERDLEAADRDHEKMFPMR